MSNNKPIMELCLHKLEHAKVDHFTNIVDLETLSMIYWKLNKININSIIKILWNEPIEIYIRCTIG